MKVSTMIFLCSLICFATCTKPIFSEALRSSASIDLDSPDQALIQTQSKNKVNNLNIQGTIPTFHMFFFIRSRTFARWNVIK